MSLQLGPPTKGPRSPSPDVLAVIVAAVEETWPRPSVEQDVVSKAESVWKFANRWYGSTLATRVRPKRPSAF